MTFLPVVERELRVAARRPATRWFRVVAVASGCSISLFSFVFDFTSTAGTGLFIFQALAYSALALCLLAGALTTADCISSEKREGTIGLLFLTDLAGFDVVFGKLAAVSLNSIYCLLAVLPLLAVPMLLGGVTADEFWRAALALVTALFFSLAAGMWVSCRETRERDAMAHAIVVIAAVAFLPFWIPIGILRFLSPCYAFNAGFASAYVVSGNSYWSSIGCIQTVSCLLLAWSCHRAPRCWRETESQSERKGGWRFGRNRPRPGILETDPVGWLAARNLDWPGALTVAIIMAALLPFLLPKFVGRDWVTAYIICCWLLNLGVKAAVAFQACHCVTAVRTAGALEMLLTTPLTDSQIVNGHVRAIKRHLRLPVLTLMGVECAALAMGLALNPTGAEADLSTWFLFFGVVPLYLLLFFLNVSALAWTGMWHGITSKNETDASLKTIFRVLLLPYLSMFLCYLYFPVVFLWPMWWEENSKQKLLARFRETVALGPVRTANIIAIK